MDKLQAEGLACRKTDLKDKREREKTAENAGILSARRNMSVSVCVCLGKRRKPATFQALLGVNDSWVGCVGRNKRVQLGIVQREKTVARSQEDLLDNKVRETKELKSPTGKSRGVRERRRFPDLRMFTALVMQPLQDHKPVLQGKEIVSQRIRGKSVKSK